jgi:hypothetical protein
MAYVGRKASDDGEPDCVLVYPWAAWAVQKIRAALAAGEPPPQFKRSDPWSWIYLGSRISRDPELRDKVRVHTLEKRVEWEPRDGDDSEAA